jgi:transcriptional regulator with XRE-family HTH domain
LTLKCDSHLKVTTLQNKNDIQIQREIDALCLGPKIRKLRHRRSLTLQEVSELSGLSKSLLSQIENEASAPPIHTLARIARALGVKISYFFREKSNAQRISLMRRHARQETVRLPHNRPERLGYRYIPLAHPTINQHMEPFWVQFKPREEKNGTYYQHPGEEFLYVQEGRLEFEGADQTIIVEPGDSLYFESSMPHMVRNIGEKTASALAVLYTPDD